jgi:hypothetical protein
MMQYASQKRRTTSSSLHGAIFQKTIIFKNLSCYLQSRISVTYFLLNRQIHTTIWYYYVISVYHNLYILK